MKKFLLGAASLMLLLGSASCSQEEIVPVGEGNGDGTVCFTVGVPSAFGDATRADSYLFGDGSTAIHLTYAAYEHRGDQLILADYSERDVKNDFKDLKTTVTMKLVNGRTYDIVFWADAVDPDDPNPIYTFDKENHKINMNYDNALQNDEKRDAFFNTIHDLHIDVNTSNQSVILKRPFAQLNIGSRDLNEPAVKAAFPNGIYCALKAKTATELDLVDGSVGDMQDVEFKVTPRPLGQTFPHQDPNVEQTGYVYEYLSMDYLLVGPVTFDKDNYPEDICVNTEFFIYNGDNEFVHSRKVANVPLKRNYQTNIFGPLLTSSTEFTVEINPIFDSPHSDVTWLDFRDFSNAAVQGGTIVLDRDIYFGVSSSWAADPTRTDYPGTVCLDERDCRLQIPVDVETTVDLNGHSLYNVSFEVLGKLNIIDSSNSNTACIYGQVHQMYHSLSWNPLFTVRKSNWRDYAGEINLYAGHYIPGRISDASASAVIYSGPYQEGTVNVYGGVYEGERDSNGQYKHLCVYDDKDYISTKVNIHGGTFIEIGGQETAQLNGASSSNWSRTTQNGKTVHVCRPDDAAKLVIGGDVTVGANSPLIDEYGSLNLAAPGAMRTKPLNVKLATHVNRVYIGDFRSQTTLAVGDGGEISYMQLLPVGDVVRNFTLKGADGTNRIGVAQSSGGQLDWRGKTVENVRFENLSSLSSIDYSGGSVSNLSYVNVMLFGDGCPIIKMKDMKRAENIVIDGGGSENYFGNFDQAGTPSTSMLFQLEDLTGDVTFRNACLYNYGGIGLFVKTKGNVTVESVRTTCGNSNNMDAIVLDGSAGMKGCVVRNNNITTGSAGNRLYIKNPMDGCSIVVTNNTLDTWNPGIAKQENGAQNYCINISRTDGKKVNCSSWSIHSNAWYGWTGWDYRSNIHIVDFPDPDTPDLLSFAYKSPQEQIDLIGYSGKNAKRRK